MSKCIKTVRIQADIAFRGPNSDTRPDTSKSLDVHDECKEFPTGKSEGPGNLTCQLVYRCSQSNALPTFGGFDQHLIVDLVRRGFGKGFNEFEAVWYHRGWQKAAAESLQLNDRRSGSLLNRQYRY